jgi:3-O-methylgallate 3,4-dioxygenase
MRDDPVPSVPLIVNNYYEPNKPTVKRCLAFGRAVARAVKSFPGDQRVALIASGGLTHFVIDEEFDRLVLDAMEVGDFDRLCAIPEHMFRSPGTGEIKNWLPLTAMAFAYWAA